MSLKILGIRYLQSFLVRDDLSHSFVPTSLPSLRLLHVPLCALLLSLL